MRLMAYSMSLLALGSACSPRDESKVGSLREETIAGYHAPKSGVDNSSDSGPYVCEAEDICAQATQHTDEFVNTCFDHKGTMKSGVCETRKMFCSDGTYVFYADESLPDLCANWLQSGNDPTVKATPEVLPTMIPTPTPLPSLSSPSPTVTVDAQSSSPTATPTPEPSPTFDADIVSDAEYKAFDACVSKDEISKLSNMNFSDSRKKQINNCFKDRNINIEDVMDKRLFVDSPVSRTKRMINLIRRYHYLDQKCPHDIKVSDGINNAALNHAIQMVANNSLTVDAGGHDGTPTSRLKTWLPGQTLKLVDEVRNSVRAPEFLMIMIKNDPVAKAIVGNCDFDSFGVGFASPDNKNYWTIDFAKLK